MFLSSLCTLGSMHQCQQVSLFGDSRRGYVSLFTSLLLLLVLLLLVGETGLIDLEDTTEVIDGSRVIPARFSSASAPSTIFSFSASSSTGADTRIFFREATGDWLSFLLLTGECRGSFTHSLRSSRQPSSTSSSSSSNPEQSLHVSSSRSLGERPNRPKSYSPSMEELGESCISFSCPSVTP